MPGDKKRTGRLSLARRAMQSMYTILGSGQLGGEQNPQSPCPGNRTCPVVDAKLAIDVAGVGLDRVQRELEPGRDLGVGQPFGDQLQHF